MVNANVGKIQVKNADDLYGFMLLVGKAADYDLPVSGFEDYRHEREWTLGELKDRKQDLDKIITQVSGQGITDGEKKAIKDMQKVSGYFDRAKQELEASKDPQFKDKRKEVVRKLLRLINDTTGDYRERNHEPGILII